MLWQIEISVEGSALPIDCILLTAAYGDGGYMIAEELSGKVIIQNKNFRKLVEDVPLFEGKTFKELLPDLDVEY